MPRFPWGFYHAGFGQVYLAANLVFACCVAACFCLLARLARAGLENERSRQSLRLQEQQYAGMRDSIEQTRRQRHDLEHHFALLSVWSQKEENLPRIGNIWRSTWRRARMQRRNFAKTWRQTRFELLCP